MMGLLEIPYMRCLWVLLIFNKIIIVNGFREEIKQELDEYLKDNSEAHYAFMTQHKVTEIRLPDLCPPPRSTFSAEDCHQPVCKSHANCTNAQEGCCFNGCIYTCLPDVFPSSLELDWNINPNNTLPVSLGKTSEDYEIECSTTKGFISPSCPNGYACQILEHGDPLRTIPNRGVCVSLKHLGHDGLGLYIDESAKDWNHLEPSLVKESVYLPGGCFLTTEQYSDIEEFIRGRHFTSCTCSAGTVLCSVPQNGTGKIH